MLTQKRRGLIFFEDFPLSCVLALSKIVLYFTNEMFTINTNKQLYRKYAKKITLLLQTSNKSKLKFSR